MRLLLIAVLLGCTPTKPEAPQPSALVEDLRQRYSGWLRDIPEGWASLINCDGTLWTGESFAAGHPVDLTLAEWAPGEIHRRPKTSGECWPKESASSVSNDMLTGYLLGSWEAKDLGSLERLATYGEAHHWQMGQPESATFFSLSGQGRLGRAIEKLGGPKKDYRTIPEPCLPVAKDYEYHLQTLAILMDGEVSGSVSDLCVAELKNNARLFPGDALIQAAVGVYSGDEAPAIKLLTSDDYNCPSYVRPVLAYCLVHKAFAAKTVLKRFD